MAAGKKFLGSTAGKQAGNNGSDDFSDFNVDLSAIPDTDIVDDGTYRCKIKRATPARSSAGKPQIKIIAELDAKQLEDGTFDYEGVEGIAVFDTLTFDPDNRVGMKINKRKLIALGIDPATPLNNITQLCEDITGVEALCAVVRSYNPNNIDTRTNEPYPEQNRINMYAPIQA
jgi:hypothetical protein